MSYIYLQEQGEVSSADSYSGIPQYARSKSKNIQGRSCCSDSETASCQNFPFGTTFAHLTANHGEDQLTFWQEDSPARTSVRRVKEQELPDHVRDSGKSMRELLTKYGLNLSLPKTHHCFELGDLELCSKIWPRWGIMQGGECWELGLSVRHTSGTGCGSWPTPTTQDAKNNGSPSQMRRHTKPLNAAVIGSPIRRKWGTPRCFMHKDALTDRGKGNLGEQVNEEHQQTEPGQLSPFWVEWLMGWPVGWTDLKPLVTDKFRNVQRWHFKFCQKG